MRLKFQIGLMITILSIGLFLSTMIVCVMTPDFVWDWKIGCVLGGLAVGIIVGARELEVVGKVLGTVDRWERAYGNLMPRGYVGSPECIDEEKAKHLLSALPDWRLK